MKELAVGDEQEARYAARQAGIEQAYATLPAPGTPAYWEALEGAQAGALPLEALVRCFRERAAAGAQEQAERIYSLVLGRSQRSTQFWARHVARPVPAQARQDLEADLEQECYLELWRVMTNSDQRFILVNFRHMLERIQDHVAHTVMEQEGYWKRPGVETPTRVPRPLIDSADRPVVREADEPDAVVPPVHDPGAAAAFEQVELAADVDVLLALLSTEDRALLHDLLWRGLTQDEIAAKLHITDRTVRNRLTRILATLRRLLAGEEEQPDGD